MTPDEAKSLAGDIGFVHYPATTPEQVAALRSRLVKYPKAVAEATIQRYARMHPDFLSVEGLLAAIDQEARGHNETGKAQRRAGEALELSQLEQAQAEVDAAVATLSDEEFADLVVEARELHRGYGEWFWRRGRRSVTVRNLVFEQLQRQARFQEAVGRTA